MTLNFHSSNLSKITQAPNSLCEIPFCLIYQESFASCTGPGCPLSSSVYLPSWCLLHPQWVPDKNSKNTGTKKHNRTCSVLFSKLTWRPSPSKICRSRANSPPLPGSLCMPPLYKASVCLPHLFTMTSSGTWIVLITISFGNLSSLSTLRQRSTSSILT